mgnify:CR=1 FL=1
MVAKQSGGNCYRDRAAGTSVLYEERRYKMIRNVYFRFEATECLNGDKGAKGCIDSILSCTLLPNQ